MNTNQIAVSNEDASIESALKILETRISYNSDSPSLTSPQASKDFVKLQLATYEHEVFACLFLDNRNRVITFEEMFRGTIDGASVYPREVVKACLSHNAAAVIFAHYHLKTLNHLINIIIIYFILIYTLKCTRKILSYHRL
jgi:DNA repair protein RadC